MPIRNKAKTVLCNLTPQIRPPISAMGQKTFLFYSNEYFRTTDTK